MLPGRALASRFVSQNETEIVRDNERLKGPAGLFATQHRSYLRSNQRFIARPCSTSRTRTRRSRDFKHVQGGAQRKSVRRLEPKRRAQNHCLRLFSSREGRTDRFHTGDLERSRKLPQEEKVRAFEVPLKPGPRPR